MRTKFPDHIEDGRVLTGHMQSEYGDTFGAFHLTRVRVQFVAIASSGDELVQWEHVSVRARDYKGERVPTWEEMCWIRDQFWLPEECVVQYHPPHAEYVNHHPCVLHLWRPTSVDLPRPPIIAV